MAAPTSHRPRSDSRRQTDRLAGAVAIIAVLAAACATGSSGAAPGASGPADLAFASEPLADDGTGATTTAPRSTATTRRRTTTTEPAPIEHGTPDRPFAPLPPSAEATALVTPAGVVLPVVSERRDDGGARSWVALTPCGDARVVADLEPLGRAHVVLDPGHGGREFGAVGPSDVAEKDVNLAVAEAARAMLTEAGATVVLTRSTDIAMTTGVRAAIARRVRPALFVSIHHNGGAPATGSRPGTIVFTKSNSPESTRFGGLFHRALTPDLVEIGELRQDEFRVYADEFAAHEATVAAYDRSVAARDAALVANGQIPATDTTLPSVDPLAGRQRIDGDETPSVRHQITTTTLPVTDDRTTVSVPETLPLPPDPATVPELTRVPEFRWAGSGNAGVRSWVTEDGRDLLSVLRRSGDVPAALVEYLYVTNPVEEALLADPAFIELEARALTDAIVEYLSTVEDGTGFVADQVGDQPIGGGGRATDCREPELGLGTTDG